MGSHSGGRSKRQSHSESQAFRLRLFPKNTGAGPLLKRNAMMLAFGLICLALGALVFIGSQSAIHEILGALLGGFGLVLISLEVILHRLAGALKENKEVLRQIQGVLDASHAYHTNIDQRLARLVTAVEGRNEHDANVSSAINLGAVNEERTDDDESPE
jgi:hypothetical protein